MSLNAARFRKMALAMTGAIERSHMNHPDFRANGRIFATLTADGKTGMVALTAAQQEVFMQRAGDVFRPAAGAWGRQGATLVALADADEETLGEAMTLAWQNTHKPSRKRRT